MTFKPSFKSLTPQDENDLWFIISNNKLLVKMDRNGYAMPRKKDIGRIEDELTHVQGLGTLDGVACHVAAYPDENAFLEGLMFSDIRRLFGILENHVTLAAGCAAQLIRWHQTHRFCGSCGSVMEEKPEERAKICPTCKTVYFPRLSPAIIVAVTKEDKILLARSGRFPGNMFSVLAGFVEIGETLEACVEREVFEETGIKVKNVTYYKSQPWPFPDSLMLGFTAEYAEGDICVDQEEIVEAQWFSADNLPNIPGRISIARHLIDEFIRQQSMDRKAG
jgi:NAD+ diphosphatase